MGKWIIYHNFQDKLKQKECQKMQTSCQNLITMN